MSIIANHYKKASVLAVTAIVSSMLLSPAYAADPTDGPLGTGTGAEPGLLQQIADNTSDALEKLDDLPTYIAAMANFIVAWTGEDTSDATSALQASFANLASAASTDLNLQNSASSGLQQQLTSVLFGASVQPGTVDYANDMSFQTLLGQPYYPKDPRNTQSSGGGQNPPVDAALNYVINAAGLNITHVIPGGSGGLHWMGSAADQQRYKNYYTTISSIQTYDAYILSRLYAEYKDNATQPNQQTILQNNLVAQVTDSKNWFAQIASENIGIVLRQILMFNSQIYVLLVQMLQVHKQMLAAQAMSNTLIVMGNQFNEKQLLDSATKPQVGR